MQSHDNCFNVSDKIFYNLCSIYSILFIQKTKYILLYYYTFSFLYNHFLAMQYTLVLILYLSRSVMIFNNPYIPYPYLSRSVMPIKYYLIISVTIWWESGGGCKFLSLYTSTLLLDRVSQKTLSIFYQVIQSNYIPFMTRI
jgi:hypothetical protein